MPNDTGVFSRPIALVVVSMETIRQTNQSRMTTWSNLYLFLRCKTSKMQLTPWLVLLLTCGFWQIVACHMSEKGPRCFRRGKSNLKTVLESL